MTTRAEMLALSQATMATAAALRGHGHDVAASRLERCVRGRLSRVPGRRPFTCRGPACGWCGAGLIARWWAGLRAWVGAGGAVTRVTLAVGQGPTGFRQAVRSLRRAWRDWRDRLARRPGHGPWRSVRIAGMLGSDLVLVLNLRHDGLTRAEVAVAIKRRFPQASVWPPEALAAPRADWSLADRIVLATVRRGVEPLRLVVAPQRDRVMRPPSSTAAEASIMPFIVP